MRNSLYDPGARKRTVSLTLNADLYAKAKSSGINLSRVAEKALAQALARRLTEQAKADIKRDLQELNAFVDTNGSFGEMVREHYAALRAMRQFDVLSTTPSRGRGAPYPSSRSCSRISPTPATIAS